MRKKLTRYLFLSVLLLLGLIFLFLSKRMGSSLLDQQEAKRWSSDGTRYTQVSVFLGGSKKYADSDVNSFRVNLSQKLEQASLKAATQSSRLWIDCYSWEEEGSAAYGSTSVDVMVTAVGGEFFAFHPLELKSGYYLGANELMKDRVVIDENLAWKLFGSFDVVGQKILVNNTPCYIAAVVGASKGKIGEYAYGSKPRLYAPMELLKEASTTTSESGSITCYEVLIPNPVKGFGKKIVTDYLFGEVQAGEEETAKEKQRTQDVEVVENTTRFNPLSLLTLVKGFGIRSMRENLIKYPYWENIARAKEEYAALYLLVAFIAFLLPAFATLRFLHRKWKHRRLRKEVLLNWLRKRREASWEKRRKIENEEDE
jgi:hypothetical protein